MNAGVIPVTPPRPAGGVLPPGAPPRVVHGTPVVAMPTTLQGCWRDIEGNLWVVENVSCTVYPAHGGQQQHHLRVSPDGSVWLMNSAVHHSARDEILWSDGDRWLPAAPYDTSARPISPAAYEIAERTGDVFESPTRQYHYYHPPAHAPPSPAAYAPPPPQSAHVAEPHVVHDAHLVRPMDVVHLRGVSPSRRPPSPAAGGGGMGLVQVPFGAVVDAPTQLVVGSPGDDGTAEEIVDLHTDVRCLREIVEEHGRNVERLQQRFVDLTSTPPRLTARLTPGVSQGSANTQPPSSGPGAAQLSPSMSRQPSLAPLGVACETQQIVSIAPATPELSHALVPGTPRGAPPTRSPPGSLAVAHPSQARVVYAVPAAVDDVSEVTHPAEDVPRQLRMSLIANEELVASPQASMMMSATPDDAALGAPPAFGPSHMPVPSQSLRDIGVQQVESDGASTDREYLRSRTTAHTSRTRKSSRPGGMSRAASAVARTQSGRPAARLRTHASQMRTLSPQPQNDDLDDTTPQGVSSPLDNASTVAETAVPEDHTHTRASLPRQSFSTFAGGPQQAWSSPPRGVSAHPSMPTTQQPSTARTLTQQPSVAQSTTQRPSMSHTSRPMSQVSAAYPSVTQQMSTQQQQSYATQQSVPVTEVSAAMTQQSATHQASMPLPSMHSSSPPPGWKPFQSQDSAEDTPTEESAPGQSLSRSLMFQQSDAGSAVRHPQSIPSMARSQSGRSGSPTHTQRGTSTVSRGGGTPQQSAPASAPPTVASTRSKLQSSVHPDASRVSAVPSTARSRLDKKSAINVVSAASGMSYRPASTAQPGSLPAQKASSGFADGPSGHSRSVSATGELGGDDFQNPCCTPTTRSYEETEEWGRSTHTPSGVPPASATATATTTQMKTQSQLPSTSNSPRHPTTPAVSFVSPVSSHQASSPARSSPTRRMSLTGTRVSRIPSYMSRVDNSPTNNAMSTTHSTVPVRAGSAASGRPVTSSASVMSGSVRSASPGASVPQSAPRSFVSEGSRFADSSPGVSRKSSRLGPRKDYRKGISQSSASSHSREG